MELKKQEIVIRPLHFIDVLKRVRRGQQKMDLDQVIEDAEGCHSFFQNQK